MDEIVSLMTSKKLTIFFLKKGTAIPIRWYILLYYISHNFSLTTHFRHTFRKSNDTWVFLFCFVTHPRRTVCMFDIILHNRKKKREIEFYFIFIFILFYFVLFFWGCVGDGGAGRWHSSSSASEQNQPPRAQLSKAKKSEEARELRSEEVISSPTCYAAGFCQSLSFHAKVSNFCTREYVKNLWRNSWHWMPFGTTTTKSWQTRHTHTHTHLHTRAWVGLFCVSY